MLKTTLTAVLGLLASASPAPEITRRDPVDRFEAEDVLARSIAAYAALKSYADSGQVADEHTSWVDRYTFRTYFTRDPRNFRLDSHSLGSFYSNGSIIGGKQQIVLWMEQGEMQSWDSKSQEHQIYPSGGGRQVKALTGASYRTMGVSVLIPSLLYTKAEIVSAIRATDEAVAAGTESVGGRRCFKVLGIERYRYPSGQVTGVRPIALWIDAETYLIRKMFQDNPKNYARGAIARRTFTFEPRANPSLEAKVFHFEVPEQQAAEPAR